jgi:hypothetical protein
LISGSTSPLTFFFSVVLTVFDPLHFHIIFRISLPVFHKKKEMKGGKEGRERRKKGGREGGRQGGREEGRGRGKEGGRKEEIC